MGRLRVTAASSTLDREVAGHVDRAARSIQAALRAVLAERKNEDYNPAYIARVRRDLERCMSALGGIRRASPLSLVEAPLSLPPKIKAPLAEPVPITGTTDDGEDE